jgi:hypothetical protein
MKTTFARLLAAASLLMLSYSLVGCGGSSGSSFASSSGILSSADREAREAAWTELQRHFVKGPDGWTASVTTGSAYAPDHFLRQFKDLAIETIEAQELTQSDHLNGFEWAGRATFKHTVCREAGGQPTFVLDGMAEGQQAYAEKAVGRWSQWVDYTPGPLRFQKQKGRWQFQWDGTYLRGQLPSPADFAAAGVR